MITARWVKDLMRQVRRGKHVLVTGNIRDLVLYHGAFVPFQVALDSALSELGYTLRPRFNVVDGITFPDAPERSMRERFDTLMRDPSLGNVPSNGGYRLPGTTPGAPTATAALPQTDMLPARQDVFLREPDLACAAFRLVLSASRDEPVSAVLDFSDKLISGGDSQPAPERDLMVLINLLASEAYRNLKPGAMAGMRNAVVLVAATLGQVPAWLYRDNPLFHVVTVDRPDAEEREEFFRQRYEAFFGVEPGVAPTPTLLDDFVGLTDGLSHWDLEALRLTSFHERLPITECRRLVDYFKHGTKDDPWEKLSLDTLRGAEGHLRQKVIGQEAAIEAVGDVLISARGGVQLDGAGRRPVRPKGVLFFVGPTGVGKTELAKAVTELIFKDPAAFARFDMSEYAQEHAAERLTGAPPSYVGYEAGGQLTNRMKARPFSLILFDEIEKAHPRIMDKFLQVLDDGRLTDGLGETVYFSQSVIVFTSNIGSTRIEQRGAESIVTSSLRADMTYEELQAHYRQQVKDHFIKMGRPEILGRIGEENIIVFDMLRPQHIEGILNKFLQGVSASAREKYNLEVRWDPALLEMAVEFCRRPDVILLGGRGIRNFIQSQVLPRVNEAVLSLPAGARGLNVIVEDRAVRVVPA